MPRVEVVGNGEDIYTRVYIAPKESESREPAPRPSVFEAQFLFHDVVALKNANCRVGELLKMPGYKFTPTEIDLMVSWMLLEIRLAVGCRFKWKRGPLVAPTVPGHCFCYEWVRLILTPQRTQWGPTAGALQALRPRTSPSRILAVTQMVLSTLDSLSVAGTLT